MDERERKWNRTFPIRLARTALILCPGVLVGALAAHLCLKGPDFAQVDIARALEAKKLLLLVELSGEPSEDEIRKRIDALSGEIDAALRILSRGSVLLDARMVLAGSVEDRTEELLGLLGASDEVLRKAKEDLRKGLAK